MRYLLHLLGVGINFLAVLVAPVGDEVAEYVDTQYAAHAARNIC